MPPTTPEGVVGFLCNGFPWCRNGNLLIFTEGGNTVEQRGLLKSYEWAFPNVISGVCSSWGFAASARMIC